ncbi:glycosyl hydrolases family 31-domain-containing protein [Russula dissimulans]|nr:glycosyl hydrolases family 31-domain-containing protein [Russula dissimulans]
MQTPKSHSQRGDGSTQPKVDWDRTPPTYQPRDDAPGIAASQDGGWRRHYDWTRGRYLTWAFGAVLSLILALLLRSAPYPYQFWPGHASVLLDGIRGGRGDSEKYSGSVADCPGYTLDSLRENKNGFTAQLHLAGPPCNAFGNDIENLTIRVAYETTSRLHVNIFDQSAQQFILPSEYFDLPKPEHLSSPESADLQFNYDPSPFAFWITRRSDPGYLLLTSSLPLDTNIYGLGEVVASSGFRRDVLNGTVQTMWNRDAADPLDENIYGSHPFHLEHRWVPSTNSFQSHGVFLASAAGSDIILASPLSSNQSLIQYRIIGGTLDLYFFSGPDPNGVLEQYAQVVGLPTRPPNWGFGFHLCRWGYSSLAETKQQVEAMRAANIPLEVMWNDLELYQDYRDFTVDPVTFPPNEMRDFIGNLRANEQHYIPIVHGSAAVVMNATDVYDPYTRGVELDVFIRNPDHSLFIGQVWPGHTVFPDWLVPNVEVWWKEALRNWTSLGVEFSGLWLDMNEPASFCDGHWRVPPVTGQPNRSPSIILPGDPGNPVTDYPEGYDPAVSGPSGNITVNGSLTYGAGVQSFNNPGGDRNVSSIEYTSLVLGRSLGDLSGRTVGTNATHHGGRTELDMHNLFGHLMARAANLAVRELRPGKRPFLISRSTFAGSGRWTGHWLGDNWSKWSYLHHSIQGVLQFQLFQIPMVGADACGFVGNTDEELCNRWMQVAAFTPFFRNHNIRGAIPQEPYRWESVAHATRVATAYTLFANSSLYGTPPVRALFFEFPQEPELLSVDRQFMVGRDILVTPVLTPNVTSVSGFLPGRGQVTWRNWYTHAIVSAPASGSMIDLDAPLGHIPVLIRSGAALLLHSHPGYTTHASAAAPYALLVSLSVDGHAYGTAHIDDGERQPPDAAEQHIDSEDAYAHTHAAGSAAQSRIIVFSAHDTYLDIWGDGAFDVAQPLGVVTILGVDRAPRRLTLDGVDVPSRKWVYDSQVQRLVVFGLSVDLNERSAFAWGW